MWVTYNPEGDEKQEWWLQIKKLRSVELEQIEARSGFDTDEWMQRLFVGNVRARRALLWTLLRRQHHTLKYEDVDFAVDELEVELDAQEMGTGIARFETKRDKYGLTELEEQVLANMQRSLPESREAPAGKAPEPNGA